MLDSYSKSPDPSDDVGNPHRMVLDYLASLVAAAQKHGQLPSPDYNDTRHWLRRGFYLASEVSIDHETPAFRQNGFDAAYDLMLAQGRLFDSQLSVLAPGERLVDGVSLALDWGSLALDQRQQAVIQEKNAARAATRLETARDADKESLEREHEAAMGTGAEFRRRETLAEVRKNLAIQAVLPLYADPAAAAVPQVVFETATALLATCPNGEPMGLTRPLVALAVKSFLDPGFKQTAEQTLERAQSLITAAEPTDKPAILTLGIGALAGVAAEKPAAEPIRIAARLFLAHAEDSAPEQADLLGIWKTGIVAHYTADPARKKDRLAEIQQFKEENGHLHDASLAVVDARFAIAHPHLAYLESHSALLHRLYRAVGGFMFGEREQASSVDRLKMQESRSGTSSSHDPEI